MKPAFGFCFIVVIALACSGWNNSSPSEAVSSAQHKIAHIEANSRLAHPNPTPAELTEPEINAYIASGEIELPDGVQSVHLTGLDGTVTGTARVDFDKIRSAQKSTNPLLSLFSGVHNVEVQAHAHGSGGTGFIHVDSVILDGSEIPHFLLELFVEKYLQPKYPGVRMDTRIQLPDKIDTATIGKHTLTIIQN